MPGRPLWYARLHEIRTALARSQAPVLDRAAIERLFGLKRRQAINLMSHFEGYLSGRHWLISRQKILDQLDRVANAPGYGKQLRAKRNLSAYVETVKAARIELERPIQEPDQDQWPQPTNSPLPMGVVCPRPGRMVIDYENVDALLATLNALALAAVADFAEFSEAVLGEEGPQ
jgi:hypothetical protein